MIAIVQMIMRLLADVVGLMVLSARSQHALEAENLMLRRQLALYLERGIKPRRIDAATRASLTFLSSLCDWRSCLTVVRPETVIRWHRAGWRLLWRWKSRPGRPSIPMELQRLIRRMAVDNPVWGAERIANELLLKLGIRVSPRTVRKYMPRRPPGRPRGDQRWSIFLRNHAHAIVACDFLVAATASFRLFYVFVLIHHGSRRLLHLNITRHPTADWTVQQFRQALGCTEGWRWLIHDRDSIFSQHLDASIRKFGLAVIRSPPNSPRANAVCERVIGTIRRECLDWVIPFSESHLRSILKSWASHYNQGRPHSSLGPGIPDSPAHQKSSCVPASPHLRDTKLDVVANRCLGDFTTNMRGALRASDRIFADDRSPEGVLLDDAEPFAVVIEKCSEIQKRVNAAIKP